MLDILLVNPTPSLQQSEWEIKLGSKLPPMGLVSLAGFLRSRNVTVDILDAYNLGLGEDSIIRKVRETSPAYVGFTATTPIIGSAAKAASLIKETFPHTQTIVGGAHISAMPVETLEKYSGFDMGVYGEGEHTLFEIIEKGKTDQRVDGLVYRDGGAIIQNNPRVNSPNLDDLPFPAYDLLRGFPNVYRPAVTNYKRVPVAPIISSRGCPFNCTFCDQSVFGHRWRSHTTAYLSELILILKKNFGVREISFYDDMFSLREDKLEDFVELYHKLNLDISWSCEGRIGSASPEMFRKMKRAGCWQISFGVESGSQEILDHFNKKIKVEQVYKTCRAAVEAGIRSRAYFIIGSPPETVTTLQETQKIIFDLPFSDVLISFYTPLPGTLLYKQLKASGSDIDMDTFRLTYTPEGVPAKKLLHFRNRLLLKFYLQPRIISGYILMLVRHPAKLRHFLATGLNFLRLLFK